METIKKYIITIVIISFIVFFAYNFYLSYQAKQVFIEDSYKGIINNIEYFEGRRGLPDVKIGNEMHYFGYEEKIIHYIQVCDSIVKESGTEEIKIYRKNLKGKWDEKTFK